MRPSVVPVPSEVPERRWPVRPRRLKPGLAQVASDCLQAHAGAITDLGQDQTVLEVELGNPRDVEPARPSWRPPPRTCSVSSWLTYPVVCMLRAAARSARSSCTAIGMRMGPGLCPVRRPLVDVRRSDGRARGAHRLRPWSWSGSWRSPGHRCGNPERERARPAPAATGSQAARCAPAPDLRRPGWARAGMPTRWDRRSRCAAPSLRARSSSTRRPRAVAASGSVSR